MGKGRREGTEGNDREGTGGTGGDRGGKEGGREGGREGRREAGEEWGWGWEGRGARQRPPPERQALDPPLLTPAVCHFAAILPVA